MQAIGDGSVEAVGSTGPGGRAQLEAWVRDGAIDTVIVAFCDMQGRLVGKRVAGRAFLAGAIDHGIHVCTYLLGTDIELEFPDGYALMSWDKGYGDWAAIPDWDTLRPLPWLPRTALVLADVVDEEDGTAIPVSPRTILRRQVEAAARLGLNVKVGTEYEYYVFEGGYRAQAASGWALPERAGYYREDYQLLAGTRTEPFHARLRNELTAAGIPVEFTKGESGAGQHELNVEYAEAIPSADRSVLLKHGVKEIAELEGRSVTFMAKPDHRLPGSSGHLHMSLWSADGSRPLSHDPAAASPHAMSEPMRHFLAGQMALARELASFYAPNVNSYKRFADKSWAPVNILWGRDNRTTGFRLVGRGHSLHVECRFPGGDMNAYLAIAAFIGAGLYGIEHALPLPPEHRGNGYEVRDARTIPGSLDEAADELERSEAAVAIFGADVVAHYLHAARLEADAYRGIVHAWERERYLERG